MDECISMLRKECSLDADPKMAELASEGISEDWTMFQNAFRLIQICGKVSCFRARTSLNSWFPNQVLANLFNFIKILYRAEECWH